MQLKEKIILITGASRGIGKSLAIASSIRGAFPIITSRKIENLREVEQDLDINKKSYLSVPLDVTSRESVIMCLNKIKEKIGHVDVLINNAGIGMFAPFRIVNEVQAKELFETNFFGVIRLIQEILPLMGSKKAGYIVNISTVISKYALYNQSIYSASKAALDRITEALAIEEARNNIKTLLVYPVKTKSDFKNNALGNKKYKKLPLNRVGKDPFEVADKILTALEKEKSVLHLSILGRMVSALSGTIPWFIHKRFLKQYNDAYKKVL